jgi:hypothetical protein
VLIVAEGISDGASPIFGWRSRVAGQNGECAGQMLLMRKANGYFYPIGTAYSTATNATKEKVK